jgi:hypothetical protein
VRQNVTNNKEFKEVKEFKEKTNDCTSVRLMWTLTRLFGWCRRQAMAMSDRYDPSEKSGCPADAEGGRSYAGAEICA